MNRRATEQDSWDAAVQGVGVARRALLVAAIGLPVALLGSYAGVAATKNYWPFDSGDEANKSRSVGELAADLDSPSSSTRLAAVTALGSRLKYEHPDRKAAIAALIGFLARRDHSNIRSDIPEDKSPPEINSAFVALGRNNVSYVNDRLDLRYADLRGLEAGRVGFSDGIPLYGANLSNAVITDSEISSSNMQEAILERAWFGGCNLTSLMLPGANMKNVFAPSTTFVSCEFSNVDISGANFSKSVFKDCRFDGRALSANARDWIVRWDDSNPPSWPDGFTVPPHGPPPK